MQTPEAMDAVTTPRGADMTKKRPTATTHKNPGHGWDLVGLPAIRRDAAPAGAPPAIRWRAARTNRRRERTMARDSQCQRTSRRGRTCGQPKHDGFDVCFNHLTSEKRRQLRREDRSPHALRDKDREANARLAEQAEGRRQRLRDESAAVRLRELDEIETERINATLCGWDDDPAGPPCTEPKAPGCDRCVRHADFKAVLEAVEDARTCGRKHCGAEPIEGSAYCWAHSGERWRQRAVQQARKRHGQRTASDPKGRPTRRRRPRLPKAPPKPLDTSRRVSPEAADRLRQVWQRGFEQHVRTPEGAAIGVAPRMASAGGATTETRLAPGRDVGCGEARL